MIPANSTDDDNDNGDFKFDWDTDTQSMVLGCFFYGYVLTQMPGGTLGKKLALKKEDCLLVVPDRVTETRISDVAWEKWVKRKLDNHFFNF